MLILPHPVSVNRMYQNRLKHGKGAGLSNRYMKWRRAAGWCVKAQKPKPIMGEFELNYSVLRKNKNADIDNLAKGLLDLIEAHQLIENDKLCVRVHGEWRTQGPKGAIVWWTEPKKELWRQLPLQQIDELTRFAEQVAA